MTRNIIYIKQAIGDESVASVYNLSISETLNELSTLSFTFNDDVQNKLAANMMEPQTRVLVPEVNQWFRLTSINPTNLGKVRSYQIAAVHVGTDLHDNYVENKLTGSQSLDDCLKFMTDGTNFGYQIHDDFKNYAFSDGFGSDFADSLLMSTLKEAFGFEFVFDNWTIHVYKKLGNTDQFVFVDGYNASKISWSEDYSNIRTYIKGIGNIPDLEVGNTLNLQNPMKLNSAKLIKDKYYVRSSDLAVGTFDWSKSGILLDYVILTDSKGTEINNKGVSTKSTTKTYKTTLKNSTATKTTYTSTKKTVTTTTIFNKKKTVTTTITDINLNGVGYFKFKSSLKVLATGSLNNKDGVQLIPTNGAVDNSNFWATSDKVNQNKTATAEYTSPNAQVWGIKKAATVQDDRFKDKDSLLSYIKSQLQDYPIIQYTMERAEFEHGAKLSYFNSVKIGNSGLLKDRLGIDVDTRIVGMTYYPQDEKQTDTLTFGNKKFDFAHNLAAQKQARQQNQNIGKSLADIANDVDTIVNNGVWYNWS